ncbi:uncharacterized protein CG5098 isoform X2 [Teleopsis dalmanni]|uniref:uncharacterized protein CG5098 isoform X2 n=1 Tax=Teleopsis dalmanni TaxID=139649 RepID=UPI0018CDAA69|nr:uncharacterized protein CG5098 isoform X2 [Teleopsis dalmanni]
MSNNNPHGHITQPPQNPSWNPLQIPSYIPRQPQLAHMSNERPMVRSPLTWHAPAPPPDSIYNFMSANHKNLEHQINPLIQPYVRGPSPFDSMDLSLQSARNAASPLNKGLHPGMGQHDFGHKQAQQQQLALHQQNQAQSLQQQHTTQMQLTQSYPIHNLSTNASNALTHTQQQQTTQTSINSTGPQHSHSSQNAATASPSTNSPSTSSIGANAKYMNTNGGDRDSMLPPPGIGSASSGASLSGNNNNGTTGTGPNPMHYLRDAEVRHSENFAKMAQMSRNYENETKSMQKPVELVNKDCNYSAIMPTKMTPHSQQVSPKKHTSPIHNYHPQQQAFTNPTTVKHNGPHTPPTPLSPASNQQSNPSVTNNANPQQMPTHSPVMQSNAGVIDYNQLHLQQNSFNPQHVLTNQSHLHYPHHQHHLHQHHSSQQTQQQLQHNQQSQQLHHSPMQQQQSNLVDMDTYPNRTEPNSLQSNIEKSQIADLSAANANIAAYKFSVSTPSNPQNPATSPDSESIDSNSNSSESRQRRKRKSSRIVRMSSSERENEDTGSISHKFGEPTQGPLTPKRCNNSRSPKVSPQQTQRKSPQNIEGPLEQPPENSATTSNTSQIVSSPVSRVIEAIEPETKEQNNLAALENGQSVPVDISNDGENQSKTAKSDTEENSNDSPKTKKQRQVLKLRSSEPQVNANNLNSSSYNENVATNDNAVLADDLRKETQVEVEQSAQLSNIVSQPLSPQSNSRSSSSSSSSSSCSNSTRSSNDSKLQQNKSPTDEVEKEKENIIANDIHGSSSSNNTMDIKENSTSNENKTNLAMNDNKSNIDNELNNSPHKSSFEEVENKLEEMFAGIEDEPVVHEDDERLLEEPANELDVARDLSLALELTTNASENINNNINDMKNKEDMNVDKKETNVEKQETPIRLEGPPPTKAAKKSTMPSPPKAKSPIEIVVPPKRINTPRRRLSTALDPANLRIFFEDCNKETEKRKKQQDAGKEIIVHLDDERPSTSAAAIAALAAKESTAAITEASLAAKKDKKSVTTGKKRPLPIIKSKGGKNNKQKQQQQQRRRANSSDDELPPTREASSIADTKYKSPYILVKKDGNVSVINAPIAEDVSEKNVKIKKAYVHDRRNLRGLHSSTLSNKYDAVTTDSTWICVFCKRGPHKMGLGDLFGPYLISTECEEYKMAVKAPDSFDIDADFISKRRRSDMVQSNARNLPVVPATTQPTTATRVGANKKKKKHSNETNATDLPQCSNAIMQQQTFLGMCKVSENSYEVWVHENCTIWAPGVFLVGARVLGLDAAVWNSTRYACILCTKPGAIICCLQRDCKAAAHVPCAQEAHWNLNETEFKVYCQNHTNPNTNAIANIAQTNAADAYS